MTPGRHLSNKFVNVFIHSREPEFPRRVRALQSTPMPSPSIQPNRKGFCANLALFFLRTVRVGFASPLVPVGVVITSEGFVAVAAEVLFLRLCFLLLDSSGLWTPGFLRNDLDGGLRGFPVGVVGCGTVLA